MGLENREGRCKGDNGAAPENGPAGASGLELGDADLREADVQAGDARAEEMGERATADVREAHAAETPEGDTETSAAAEHGFAGRANEKWSEEDETQLTAIRELMTHASARGVWLTLGEIAHATEFAEASISAQLRHLRKARPGGYRVEKRRRRPARAAAARRRIRDGRKGPVLWEYRVLGHQDTQDRRELGTLAGPRAGHSVESGQSGAGEQRCPNG